MIVNPKDFIEHAALHGCTSHDLLQCADRVTSRLDIISVLYSRGQQIYFTIDPIAGHIVVVTNNNEQVMEQHYNQYSELFNVIKLIAH